MTKKSRQSRSRLSTILAIIVVLVAALLSLFGEDLEPDPTPTSIINTVSPPGTVIADLPDSNPVTIPIQQGFGVADRFWQVYFTAPTGSRNPADYVGGIDNPLAEAINAARGTIDIAAYEFNNPLLTEAVLSAHSRGVQVRVVTDNEAGLEDDDSTVTRLIEAGIPVVADDRSALMHNKFVIIDSTTVWTGSMNFTVNGVYRNNNNLLALRSRRAVDGYQSEFNEMFERGEFGPRSTSGNGVIFNQDGVPIQVIFAPEGDVLRVILENLETAESSIRFMAFSFTVDEIANVIQQKAAEGVQVQGIFETLGSETQFSELTALFCTGLAVRQDGNPFILHHKVFIVDGAVVLTGSFNFSDNATRSNDENMVIIEDRVLAAQYLAEFERRWTEATTPQGLSCS